MDTHGVVFSWQLMEGEKMNQSLRAELRDQEELVHRLMTLETENNALSAEINQVSAVLKANLKCFSMV